jgi:hypothetical protein
MVCQDNELLLNSVLISLSRSFLQYVAESSPWIRLEATSVEHQIQVLASRQRQHVAELVHVLVNREYPIDFGSFPTEYTDLQFLSLETMLNRIQTSMSMISAGLKLAAVSLQTAGDTEGSELVTSIEIREQDIARALREIAAELGTTSTAK